MRVVKDSPLSLAWITFPVRPPTQTLVVVAKATFDLRATGVCELSEQQELVTGDTFWEDDIERSVRYDSDLAVAKPQAEWWVTGVWRPAPGRVVTHAVVDVGVANHSKRIALIGDRWWRKGVLAGPTDPLPLTDVPMSYDRAFGGPRYTSNPFGMGIVPDTSDPEQRIRLPNIEDPSRLIGAASDRPNPAGMFPISRVHGSRTALTGTYRGDYMSTRWPYFPRDFQWSYFQAAPPDQRARAFFLGDERITASNLHPDLPSIRAQLPGIEPRVFLHPAGGPPGSPLTQVAMVLDTLVVDATEAKVMAVWRGHVDGVQESLGDVSHIFLVHEPRSQVGTVQSYRAWFDRRIEEEDDEDAAFEPAPIPDLDSEPTVVMQLPPAQMLEGAEDAPAEEPALETPLGLIEARREELAREGVAPEIIDVLAPLPNPDAAPPVPPDPATARRQREEAVAALRELGHDQVADVIEAEDDEPEEEPTEPKPEPPLAPLTPRQEAEKGLREGASFEGVMLAGVDLSGLDFSERNLRGCVLARANITGCRFVRADLSSAVLDGATLDDAVFEQGTLTGANFDGVTGERVSFRGANLEDARGESAHLPGADFSSARADRVELPRARLSRCNFDRASLNEA